MKKEDLNLFKGEIKDAIQQWIEGKIDTLFPQKAATKHSLKTLLTIFFQGKIRK